LIHFGLAESADHFEHAGAAERHGAQAETGDKNTCVAELLILHAPLYEAGGGVRDDAAFQDGFRAARL
jgi:hypothetical protein